MSEKFGGTGDLSRHLNTKHKALWIKTQVDIGKILDPSASFGAPTKFVEGSNYLQQQFNHILVVYDVSITKIEITKI